MKRLLVIAPVVAALALGGVVAWDWALGEPSLHGLSRAGDAPQLPPMDGPCAGNVITADPSLDGSLFARAAVILCLHDSGGALGFVVNQPVNEHVRAVLPGSAWTGGSMRWGGPVSQGQGAVIYRRDGELRFTTMELAAPFPETGWLRPPRVRDDEILYVFSGYAGWSPGQLENEVEDGAWVLTDVPPDAYLRDTRPPWHRDGG